MSAFDTAIAGLGIPRSGNANAPVVKTQPEAEKLDQGAFLSLLTAQLKNQDPFEPVKNEDLVAQLATFSSSTGIAEINTTLKSLVGRLDSQSGTQALAYVGKTVQVAGDTAYPQTGGGFDAAVDLDAPASDVQVTISDASGNVLRTLSLGQKKAGAAEFSWDGKTETGEDAGAGPFKVAATALTEGTGKAVPVLVWAPVTSVTVPPDGSGALLNIAGLGQKPITAVRQIG